MYVNPMHPCNCLMIVLLCDMQHPKYVMWQCIFCVPLFVCVPNLSFAPTDKNLGCGAGGVTFKVSRSGWSVWTTMINPLTCETMIQIHFHKHSRTHTAAGGGHLTVYTQSLFSLSFVCVCV